jgi:hypothetical protein
LFKAAGDVAAEGWNYWRSGCGNLAAVEACIAELEATRATVQQQLNGCLREPIAV